MNSHSSDSATLLPAPPDLISGGAARNMGGGVANNFSVPLPHSSFSFMPIGPAPSSAFLPAPVKPSPVPSSKGAQTTGNFQIKSVPLYQNSPIPRCPLPMRFPSSYITGAPLNTKTTASGLSIPIPTFPRNINSVPTSNEAYLSSLAREGTPYQSGFVPSSRIGPTRLKRKTNDFGSSLLNHDCEPKPKVHLNEELVAQTMSELYISNPRPKVARRNLNCDVAEATNMTELLELEDKFTHAAIAGNDSNIDLPLPPQRSRKLPSRNNAGRNPQMRLSIHTDFKNFKATSNIVPDSIMARYRPQARDRAGGSTAVVLWRPPGGIIPDVISSALRSERGGRGRQRTYSEVTSTPYSSHENLADTDMAEVSSIRAAGGHLLSSSHSSSGSHSPISAEAPELSHPINEDEEVGKCHNYNVRHMGHLFKESGYIMYPEVVDLPGS